MKKKAREVCWEFNFFNQNKTASALATIVLMSFILFSLYWVEFWMSVLLLIIVVFHMRELFFTIKYNLNLKESLLTTKILFFKKKVNLSRFSDVSDWKNGLFLSTIDGNSIIDNFRGCKIFVAEEEKNKLKEIINEVIAQSDKKRSKSASETDKKNRKK
ncbi:MAG: hypothetical protein ACQESP_04865 [Candidatus Muiribacteriota bacterium]